MDTYLVARAGSTSGLGIRSIRVCVNGDELKAALAEHSFPGRAGARAEFPYRLRVYACTPNAQPKKLNERRVLALLGVSVPGKFPDSPPRDRKCGIPLSYGRLQELKDKAIVWVRYQNPDTGAHDIDEPMQTRRSFQQSTKEQIVWKLISLKDKRYWEYFIQNPIYRSGSHDAVDTDGMRLHEIKR